METAILIIDIIGFAGLAIYVWVLNKQIRSQRGLLDAQSKTIESMKMYVDIFEPQKLHEFVNMREITFEDKKNKEIEKIILEMEAQIKKRENAFKVLIEELGSTIHIIFRLAYYVHPDLRKTAMASARESYIKSGLFAEIEKMPYYGDDKVNALREAFSRRFPGRVSDKDLMSGQKEL